MVGQNQNFMAKFMFADFFELETVVGVLRFSIGSLENNGIQIYRLNFRAIFH